jgi:hypothetical protein
MRVAIQKKFTHNFKLASPVGWALPTSIQVSGIRPNLDGYQYLDINAVCCTKKCEGASNPYSCLLPNLNC